VFAEESSPKVTDLIWIGDVPAQAGALYDSHSGSPGRQNCARGLVNGEVVGSVTVPPNQKAGPVGRHGEGAVGSVHGFSNPHDVVALPLIVNSPDIGAGYFREVAALAGSGRPPDRTRLVEVMRRYGLVPAAAPAPVGGT
jgi:hypothetical protein